ncbi:MAG: hypothetical protein RBR30_06755 [Tenuifilaceae bacterium]|nr:hypothetical protein [Tenuifilaceae bacterium]
MEFPQGTIDHRENEFFSYRYSTRFQKGDIVDIRTGLDLEAARFQARKSFPDVLNEYWWLKPSDIPALKDLPLKITDIYFYHGGVPVVVLNTANGTLARKAQVFLKKRDEPKHNLDDSVKEEMVKLPPNELASLLVCQDLLVRLESARVLRELYPDFTPTDKEQQVSLNIINANFDMLLPFGEGAVDQLIERFLVTTNAKETERIIDTLIAIGEPAIPRLDDISEFISLMASPYYAKRINWTINQIKKKKVRNK